MFGSDVPIALSTIQAKFESLVGQDRGCRPGDPIASIQGDECFLLYPLLRGFLHCRLRTKVVKNFLQSLGTDFYQDGCLKLISRDDKCMNSVANM
ncbi:hypothetical protein AVEN_235098-1 [Araneus ventricosus]|uniref:Uncharacterized protein n=1 Tax=Araneus ventricosus TaxID=182803 RepID=A0A4Y2PNM0_ARAVE|nr:hypothetical protein AVEN_235098-1 [Araneus ventricosus]